MATLKTGAAVGGAAAAKQQLRAQFDSIQAREELVHSPCAAHVGHVAWESMPQLLMAGGGGGGMPIGAGASVRGDVGAVGVVLAHDGLQLRAQFEAIQTCAAPVHCPCAAHVGHVACESVPTHDGAAERGAAVATMKTGAAVGGAAAAEQQLRAQFDSIHAREELAHSPCAAQAAHEACKTRTNQ